MVEHVHIYPGGQARSSATSPTPGGGLQPQSDVKAFFTEANTAVIGLRGLLTAVAGIFGAVAPLRKRVLRAFAGKPKGQSLFVDEA